jgi:PAS domain S-box-containing protein
MQEFSAVVDCSGTILYRNRTSPSPAVLTGSNIYDAVRPNDCDAMRAALRQAFQTGEIQLCEVVSRFSGASYRARLVPIFEDVRVVAVFVGAADISEQKRMEEGLRDSLRAGELRYRALVEAVPDLVFHLDAEGRFLDFLPAPGQQLLAPPSEFLGRTASEVLPADLARWVMHHIEQALQTGRTQAFQYRIPAPLADGDLRDFEARIAPSGTDKVVAVVRDVTSSLRTREALEESEAKYHKVFEHVHDVFYRADTNGAFTEISPSVEWWGHDAEQLIGAQVSDVYEDPQERSAFLKGLLEQGRVIDYEVRLKTGDGRLIDASVSSHLLRGPDGAVVGIEGIARDITERKRAEHAIRESEERLRTLITNAPIVLFAIDREGVFTIVEGRGLSGLGLRPGENVGRSVFDVYRDVPEVIDAARRALAGESFTAPVEPAGLTLEGHYAPLRDQYGQVCGGIGVGTDITERKRAEEALRASEERWRSLVQNSPDVIMSVARDGTLVLINRTLSGFPPPEQIVGASVYDFIPPQDHDTMRGALERAYQTGEPDSFEIAGSGPHRTISYYACRLAPVEYDGQVASVNLIATDVTERKRAEEALRESEERFRRLSEATLDGIVIHDGERILDANPQAAAMVGYELSELIGMDAWRFLAPDWHDLARQQILSGYGESYEVWGLRKDGTTFPMEVCAKTASYEGRRIRVGVMRDISERKRAEEAAQAAREELESRVENAMRRGNPYGLTFRELTVLYLMAAGRADKEIAFQLGISPRTASKHVENILEKMGVASRTEASVQAVREDLAADAD